MKNYLIYIILWGGGLLISFVLVFTFWREAGESGEVILFDNEKIVFTEQDFQKDIISELLMSAEEMKISGITLVSPKVRRRDAVALSADRAGDESTTRVYKQILSAQLKKISDKHGGEIFSIKPVPKPK